jgi:hypothetical protein
MSSQEIKDLLEKDYVYPDINDKNLQSKIYKKREFYYHKIPETEQLKKYDDIKRYRDDACTGKLKLYSHQSFLSNFIHPSTPYRGLLIFHGTGTGKTGTAISIAENFKSMVLKYNTKIMILVPGPLLKENWKNEIIKFSSLNNDNTNQNLSIEEEQKNKNDKLKELMYFYKIMTHRKFYKKVLGEKIKDYVDEDEQVKKYRKTDEGDFERDVSTDKLENLDNTILIVDEVHNFTGNEHGEALKMIIKKSKNLRLLLLSATPMKNLGTDIIEIINYLRPVNDQIKKEKIFNLNNYSHLIDFKEGGREYFENMCNGYISYYRGANPLLFAIRNEIGEIPEGLIFTKCVRCKMDKFQQETYNLVSKTNIDDKLERSTTSVANIAIPVLSKDKLSIVGSKGEEGVNIAISNLRNNKAEYLNKLNKMFFNNKISNVDEIMYESKNTDNITGLIYKKEYLKQFSTKFYEVLDNIDKKVEGLKGSSTIFIYSNLVKVGIEVFQEILMQNGFLEFREDQNYKLNENVIDYKTGVKYSNFFKKYPDREFFPATFIKITGKSDDIEEELPEVKKKILDDYFNNIENIEGKFIKIILGSKVMNEGITLENVSQVHILDVYYNFGRVEQVIGRAIRQCKHYNVTSEKNPFPKVDIYKYVVRLEKGLSSEENLYRKAELKYLLVKKIERSLKRVSVDCAINYNGNVFKDDIEKNKNCIKPKIGEEKNKNVKFCDVQCDFTDCDYECFDKKINLNYYDKNSKIFKKINKLDLDYTTFTDLLAKNEINFAKDKIKQLFKKKYVYTLDEILKIVKNYYKGEQKELFEDWFIYQALEILLPTSENDFNKFNDNSEFIYDKFNNPGYLIYRGTFYIFQPTYLDENIPLFYRKIYNKDLSNQLNLYSYLKNEKINKEIKKIKSDNDNLKYDFVSIKKYYDEREENSLLGILDKNKNNDEIFKLRNKKSKNVKAKRGEGIQSLKGAVCHTSNDKDDIKKMFKTLDIKYNKELTRIDLCDLIKEKLLYLEKYSTGKNNKTFTIVPFNHDKFIFPYNLEDRIRYVRDKFNIYEKSKISFNISKKKNGIFLNKRDKNLPSYEVSFTYKDKISKNTQELLDKYNFIKKNNNYTSIFE